MIIAESGFIKHDALGVGEATGTTCTDCFVSKSTPCGIITSLSISTSGSSSQTSVSLVIIPICSHDSRSLPCFAGTYAINN